MSKNRIAFIVEGTKTEPELISKSLNNVYFLKNQIDLIILPAGINIYNLYLLIKDDNDLDIITLIKEQSKKIQSKKVKKFNQSIDLSSLNQRDFSSIYLFFDYDAHQDNLPSSVDRHTVIKDMLETFNNETESGKLYLSYPMVEAIKDFETTNSFPQRNFIPIKDGKKYKQLLSSTSSHLDFKTYDRNLWNYLLTIYIIKIHYLLNLSILKFSYATIKNLSTITIYKSILENYDVPLSCIPILSAFPEFILDYFSINYINENITLNTNLLENYSMFCHSCNREIKTISSNLKDRHL